MLSFKIIYLWFKGLPVTLLYIDDDPDDREIFCEAVMTVSPAVECLIAADGTKGLDLLRTHHVDIVFVDFRMPHLDGRSFLQEVVLLSLPTIPKVYLYSTFMNEFEIEECRKMGAFDCILKPGNFAEICALVDRILKNSP